MAGIALPILLVDSLLGETPCDAKVTSLVDLATPTAKGIHMSRLYLRLQQHQKSDRLLLSPKVLTQLLEEQIAGQQGLSQAARLCFSFDLVAKRPALKSSNAGWKAYPITVNAQQTDDRTELELGIKVPYSSTCPCSAALSRQRLSETFEQDFAQTDSVNKEDIANWLLSARGSIATPHSQRSWATLNVRLDIHQLHAFPVLSLINQVESTLATPVQTAVKRIDEQAFAELNGSNLMFCEDAARRLTSLLNGVDKVSDFWIKVEHLESLHAHDAIAINTKGVKGGYVAEQLL